LLRGRAFLLRLDRQNSVDLPRKARGDFVNPWAAELAWNVRVSARESRGISAPATSSRMVRREAEEHMV
jgi:hypothetical protein